MRPIHLAAAAAVVVMVLFLAAQPAESVYQVRKISGVMPDTASVSDSAPILISPDGKYVVFSADRESDEVYDLYAVPIRGGVPVKLSQPGYPGRQLMFYKISPDSQRVVFQTDQITRGMYEIYSVPITGGTPVRLNITLPAGGRVAVNAFKFSSDSTRVVYLADQPARLGQYYLYSVPAAGGASIQLNQDLGNLGDGGDVDPLFDITPDSQYVVFMADQGSVGSADNIKELFYTPLTTQSVNQLSGELPAGTSVTSFIIMPDSSGVVFRSVASDYTNNLHRSNFYSTSGPGVTQLTNCISGGDIGIVRVTNNSTVVVFQGDCFIYEKKDVIRVPVDGSSSPVRLSHSDGNADASVFHLSDNNAAVVFNERADDIYNLFGNVVSGTPIVPVQYDQPGTSTTGVLNFAITPNSLGVVFMNNSRMASKMELFSRDILTQENPIVLNGVLPEGGEVIDFKITPNSLGVVYSADMITDNIAELFLVSIFGGTSVRLNAPFVNVNGDIYKYYFSPSGKQVVYLADAEVDGKRELYMVEDVRLTYLPVTLK